MTNLDKYASVNNKDLSKAQLNFLEYLKRFGWGKLEVTVVNGEPVGSKELEKTHRYDI